MNLTPSQEQFWLDFIVKNNLSQKTKCLETFSFGYTKELIDELTDLVLRGQKTATCSAVFAYKKEEDQPHVNDYSMVIDFNDNPIAIIQTQMIQVVPFNQVTWDFAQLEGEDSNLESWQSNHRKFFKEEGILLGYTFTEDMLVITENFKVVYRI